jgi:DNA-directed RNA polymerase omega subunit
MSKNALLSTALKKIGSRFLLVNLMTKRIRQLKDGVTPRVERGTNSSVEDIALREIAEGKVTPRDFMD